jgi:maleate isomerase
MPDVYASRAKVGVVLPSTNTICEPDNATLAPAGVTNHTARIAIANITIDGDAAFDRLIRMSVDALDEAVDRVMDAAPDVLLVGMSSLLVWDGFDVASERRAALAARTGVPVTGGSFAILEAARRLAVQRIAIVSPYQPVADGHITRFFEGAGLSVTGFESLRCPAPRAIAEVEEETIVAALDRLDGDGVQALVQFGTNLGFRARAAAEWRRRGKPVIAINPVAYWHALRLVAIEDPVDGLPTL